MRDEFEAKAVFVREAPTLGKGTNYLMAAGSQLRFDSPPPPYHRKTIFITNRHSTVNLFVSVLNPGQEANGATPYNDAGGDGSNNSVQVWYQSTLELPTNSNLIIKNASAANVEVQILEFFYA